MQSSQHKAKNSLRNLAQDSKQGLKQTPLVSIIVPIYNVASYLKECLQSIVAQSYENLDIILIDDGSDDESLKIALNFAENDKRIFVISKPNGGQATARNFGLEFIKGSALRTFFDDGDFSPTAQNDKEKVVQYGKNKQDCHTDTPCHNEIFSCHTERSEVSQTQNIDISLSTKAQYDKEYNTNSLSCHTELSQESEVSINSKRALNSMDISHSLNMTNDSKEIFHYAQNDKVKASQYDKNQACHNETFSCHTERSEVSQTQNIDISLSEKVQNDTEKAFQTNTSIQSLSQTHSFEKSYKSIDTQELRAHFTQIKHNFIKSDLERINDFITQELPQNALIHFVDSDDYITQDCVAKCVQALFEKDLDIIVHNNKEFDDNTKKITILKRLSQFQSLKQDEYNSGLELLAQNQIYDFYFAWQGLFKANILNHYALRFTEGIYHEDHDFGTLLFCLAGKISYTNEPLYIYRQRANSTMSGQKNSSMPTKLPSFLEPLRADFKDYKALRAYFKSFCFVLVGFNIWEFFRQKSEQNDEFRQEFRVFFEKQIQGYIKNYILISYYYGEKQTFYTAKIRDLLRDMGYDSLRIWYFCIYYHLRIIWRHPFKFIKKLRKEKQTIIDIFGANY